VIEEGEGGVEDQGDLEPDIQEGEPVWRANPRIEPIGLDIGGMST
jgi:hypothetical protein